VRREEFQEAARGALAGCRDQRRQPGGGGGGDRRELVHGAPPSPRLFQIGRSSRISPSSRPTTILIGRPRQNHRCGTNVNTSTMCLCFLSASTSMIICRTRCTVRNVLAIS